MRIRKFTVRKYKHPRLKFVLNYREAGKRKRMFFETKERANAEAALKNAQQAKSGTEGAEFPARLREMAKECDERLSACGRTLKDATDFFLAHIRASEKSCNVAALVEEMIAKKVPTASRRYLDDLRNRLGFFAKAFGERTVATIASAEIDDWLDSLKVSATTRNNYRRVLIVMFGYAVKRGFATSNAAADTEKANGVADAPPGILTVAQTAQLLENASQELLPYVAIGAFAGLRRAELERLDWSEIDFDADLIEVTAKKSKTARRRFVRMQANLREWLLPARRHSGKVAPDDFRKQFAQARTGAGLTVWPSNALRHSFASYHLAHFKDAAALALEMGHTNSGMIFAHYRQLVRPKDAERYWNIRPAGLANVVHLAVQA